MNTKTILIVGAIAVVGYYIWKKSKATNVVTKEGTSNFISKSKPKVGTFRCNDGTMVLGPAYCNK